MKKILFTALFALISTLAFSQERIAVFPFEDMDNVFTGNQSVMFYQGFGNEFRNRSPNNVSIVPRQDVERLINVEMDFQLSEFSAREKTAEMNRVLNGTQILSGRIAMLDNEILITVSLFTYPELDWLPGGVSRSVSNTTQLFRIIPELVQEMQDIIAGGVTGQYIPEGLQWEIVDGRTVTITKYLGEASVLNIPSQIDGLLVTAIGDSAFFDSSLTSVTIPSSVTFIGNGAFRESIYLTSVTIPSLVTFIGEFAFYACTGLARVTIPLSVTIIGTGAFAECTSLTSITIPASVTSIGAGAFSGCESLTSITVDNRNPSYASIDGVLFDKNIRTLIKYPAGRNQRIYIIPSSVTTIYYNAFAVCTSLTNVTIPSSVISIGDGAFASCNSLTSIYIPSSVISIGDRAFAGCNSLTSIDIPYSVTSIGNSAFSNCSSLTSITVDTRNPNYASMDGVFFDKSIQTLISYPVGRNQRTYVIPSSVISIEDGAFASCNSLTNIAIPSSVTFVGGYAFYGCTGLTSITIPSSVMSIGFAAFTGCDNLTNVTLSRRTQVEENAFPESVQITYWD